MKACHVYGLMKNNRNELDEELEMPLNKNALVISNNLNDKMEKKQKQYEEK